MTSKTIWLRQVTGKPHGKIETQPSEKVHRDKCADGSGTSVHTQGGGRWIIVRGPRWVGSTWSLTPPCRVGSRLEESGVMVGREGEVLGPSDWKSQRADLSCSDGVLRRPPVLSAQRGEGSSFDWASV